MLHYSEISHGVMLPSSEEMSSADSAVISRGVSSCDLMHRAGRSFLEKLIGLSEEVPSHIVVLCGPGNNGGDGLVIAKLARERGASVSVFLASSNKFSSELLNRLREYQSEGGEVFSYPEDCKLERVKKCSDSELLENLKRGSVWVDALLGTGQRGSPRGPIEKFLDIIATAGYKPRLIGSVDVPTGVNSDTGEVYREAIAADFTVTFGAVKRGLIQSPAFEHCGEIFLKPKLS